MNHPFDLKSIFDSFLVHAGMLYRIAKTGAIKQVSTQHNQSGYVSVTFEGKHLKGSDVAWALHHGMWPMYPVFHADGNPHSFSVDNLLPIRGPWPRCRIEKVPGGGYKHPLSQGVGFPNEGLARNDWHRQVSSQLREALPFVFQQIEEAKAQYLADGGILHAPRTLGNTRRKSSGRPASLVPERRPKAQEGWTVVRYEGELLAVPEACHVSDDLRIRAYEVKYNGATAFRFDPALGRTVVAATAAQP